MAYVGVTNVVSNNTSGLGLFTLKEALKLAGWTVVTSGTGTAGTTGAGDLITTGTGTAIGSFARANAWVRMREPSTGTREYILQNGGADNSTNAIIKYSRATGFTAGATATVAPTTGGGDGIVFVGTGTDASPTNAAWLPGAGTGYYHCVASDTASNGVWGWWWYGYTTNPIANQKLLGTEAIAPGSTPANDADQSVRYRDNISNSPNSTLGWWEAYGLVGQTYRTGGSLGLYYNIAGTSLLLVTFTGLDPYTSLVPFYPGLCGIASQRVKGFSTEAVTSGFVNNALDTFNLSSAQPKITLYGTAGNPARILATPWVPNVIPLS